MTGSIFSRVAAMMPNESQEGYCTRMRGTTSCRERFSCSTAKWLRFPFGYIFINHSGFNDMDFLWLAKMALFGIAFLPDPPMMNMVGVDS